MTAATYVVALGSNRRGRHGSPRAEVVAALAAIGAAIGASIGATIGAIRSSRIVTTAPIGPSKRRFANAVALVESSLSPSEMLDRLQSVERDFGRRAGQTWGARVLDLDIILWSGGSWEGAGLVVPHPRFRTRGFVLAPLADLAPDWRDPVTHLSVRQLHARLTRPRPSA